MAEPPKSGGPPATDPALAYAAALDELLAEAEGPLLAKLQRAALRLGGEPGAPGEWYGAALARACADLEDGLARLDFTALDRPGWLARTLGGGMRLRRDFIDGYEQVLEQDTRLKACTLEFAQRLAARAAAWRAPLLDLELEERAMGDAVARATAWLESLSASVSPAAGGHAGLLAFARAVPGRLKRLHLLQTAADKAVEHGRGAETGAQELLDLLQKEWRSAMSGWRQQIGAFVDRPQPGAPLEAAAQVHKQVRRLLHRVHGACSLLKHQEDRLRQGLDALSPAATRT